MNKLNNYTLLIAFIAMILACSAAAKKKQAEPALPPSPPDEAVAAQFVLGDRTTAESLFGRLSLASADSLARWLGDFNGYPRPDTLGGMVKIEHRISDTLIAPAFLFVPENYNPDLPTPLIVNLHGGVSGPEFRDMTDYNWQEDERLVLSQREGWLTLFPMGKVGCLWWDPVGMANIDWLVREVKRRYNVDDNRVIMCGFSDGASGSFHFGMLNPTDYGFFAPWSGHLAVGSLAGPSQDYISNLLNRPTYATVGGRDQLYPTERMAPLLTLALDAGAPFWVTSYDTAGHNAAYMIYEWPLFAERVRNRPREPFPMRLYWELDDLRYNRVDWLEVTGFDTTRLTADWHKDYNLKLVDDRVTIGFMHDPKFEGPGVRINGLTDDTLQPAVKVGFKPGDILVALDSLEIPDIAGLNQAKSIKKRGDPVRLTVLRDGEKLTFESSFPPVKEFDAFKRHYKSAAVKAQRMGNRFFIETSRLKDFIIYLNSEMTRFDQPVVIEVDGRILFDGLVQPDSRVMLSQFLRDRDRCRLWWGKIEVKVKD